MPSSSFFQWREAALDELPGDVQMVAFVYDLLGPRALWADPLSLCSSCSSFEHLSISSEIDCTAFEVERSRRATHPTIVLRRAAAGGNAKLRMGPQKSVTVGGGVWAEAPSISVTGTSHNDV